MSMIIFQNEKLENERKTKKKREKRSIIRKLKKVLIKVLTKGKKGSKIQRAG